MQRDSKILFDRRDGCGDQLPAGNDDEIERAKSARGGRVRLLSPEDVAEHALGSIARDGIAHASRRDDAEAVTIERVGHGEQGQIPQRDAAASFLDRRELRANAQANRRGKSLRHAHHRARAAPTRGYDSDETVRRFRPLARRRLSTIRPFLVRIRTRKPWVRRRRRRLG